LGSERNAGFPDLLASCKMCRSCGRAFRPCRSELQSVVRHLFRDEPTRAAPPAQGLRARDPSAAIQVVTVTGMNTECVMSSPPPKPDRRGLFANDGARRETERE
jgi:hypothetical protein